jgi:outer membrane protein TolC
MNCFNLKGRWPIFFVLVLGLLLAGCKGVPTEGEKQARREIYTVGGAYRPNNRKPALSPLSPDSSLSNFLTYAMLNQPKVEAAYYDWAASIERITQARSFPDPQFAFEMDIQKEVMSIMPGLMGAFPWPDKLRVGANIASAESKAKYFVFQSTVLESAFSVKRAYLQLYFLSEKIRVNSETLKLLTDLEELARSQNEVGKVTLQDVLRAQIEHDRLSTEVANLEDSRSSLIAQLKGALGMKAEDDDPPTPSRFEPTPLELTSKEILATALARNNGLKAIESELTAADASITLARQSRLPDFSLGFMADVKANPTMYRVPGDPATISIPIWRDKIAAQIAEAQANKRSAEARLSAGQIALAVDFADRSYRYREATRNVELLDKQLIPKARRSLEVARSGYLGGQIDFFNLTDSERTLLGFQLEKVDSTLQREIILTELSLIIQGMSSSGSGMAAGTTSAAPQRQMKKAKSGAM